MFGPGLVATSPCASSLSQGVGGSTLRWSLGAWGPRRGRASRNVRDGRESVPPASVDSVVVRSGQMRIDMPVRPRSAERLRPEADLQGTSDSFSEGGTRKACRNSVNGRVRGLHWTSMRPQYGLCGHLKARMPSFRGLVTADSVDLANCWTVATACLRTRAAGSGEGAVSHGHLLSQRIGPRPLPGSWRRHLGCAVTSPLSCRAESGSGRRGYISQQMGGWRARMIWSPYVRPMLGSLRISAPISAEALLAAGETPRRDSRAGVRRQT